MNIYSYNILQYDNDKIWCFDVNNEINFHKKKISAVRVELLYGRAHAASRTFKCPASTLRANIFSVVINLNYYIQI